MMKRKSHLILAVTILLIGSLYSAYLIWETTQQQKISLVSASPEPPTQALFLNERDTSQDAASLQRVVRGKIVQLEPSQNTLLIDAWVNFPDKAFAKQLSLTLTPRTQFLCWKQAVTLADGTESNLEDAAFLLSDTQKLYQKGEQRLSIDEARPFIEATPRVPVIVALQTPFNPKSNNNAYQVALLGCQQ